VGEGGGERGGPPRTSFNLSGKQVKRVAAGYARRIVHLHLQMSLSPSPPFSVSQQAGRGLIKNFHISRVEQYIKKYSNQDTIPLKVGNNEKERGSGRWQMIDIGLRLW
jgi:hypothetical protein